MASLKVHKKLSFATECLSSALATMMIALFVAPVMGQTGFKAQQATTQTYSPPIMTQSGASSAVVQKLIPPAPQTNPPTTSAGVTPGASPRALAQKTSPPASSNPAPVGNPAAQAPAASASAAAAGASASAPVAAPTASPAGSAATKLSLDENGIARPQEVVFPNGLKVVILEDHALPVVSCLVWYKVGSRNESLGSTGLSHLVEHLLFGAVGSFRRGEIGASIARVGGQFNGYTSDDFTAFFETLPANKLELALKIESERMRGATFTEEAVREEVSNIQSEFETESKDPVATISKEIRASLFQQHPYHHPIMGWRSDVENLTADQAKSFYDKFFWPDNATLVISGDVQPRQVLPLVQRYFGPISKSPAGIPVVKAVEPPQRGERRVTVKHSGKQEALIVSYHAPAMDDVDAAPMVVIEKLLNVTTAGRLKAKLVEPKICASAVSSFEIKKDPGLFTFSCNAIAGTPNAQQKMLDGLDAFLNVLKTQNVSDIELRRAKNQAEFAFFTERDGPYRAGFHLGYFDSMSKWQNAYTWTDRLKAVTASDVQRVARKFFNPDNRVVGWLAGAAAPKPVAPKPNEPGTTPGKTPGKPDGKPEKPEGVRLTGYKLDDNAVAPNHGHFLPGENAIKINDATNEEAILIAAADGPTNVAEKGTTKVEAAVKEIPSALPHAVEKLPSAIGHAPDAVKQIPAAVKSVPEVLKSVPSAVGNIPSAIKQVPSAIGSIPSAIKELPSAIVGIPGAAATAIKDLPSAVGSIPGAAAATIKGLPTMVGGIPGAAASAIKGMPGAIGTFANEVGTIPGAFGKQLAMLGPRDSSQASRVERRTLKNGLTLLVVQSRLSPIVQIFGGVKAGSAYEPAGKHGLACLAATTLNRGSSKRGKLQITTSQEDLGLSPHAMLRFDETAELIQFQARYLSRDLPWALELIAESLCAPQLNEEEFEKAKQDALQTLRQADDSIEQKVERGLLRSVLSAGSPLIPDDPQELIKSVSTLTATDHQKFFNTLIVPGATTIVMVGDIDADKALAMSERAFGSWIGKANHPKIIAHANQRRVLRAAIPIKDKARSTICFGQLTSIPKTSQDFASLQIADGILLNHPLTSRLSGKISSEPALSHAVSDNDIESRLRPLANSTAWSLSVNVEPNAVPITVQSLQDEFKKLVKAGVTNEEFAEAKRYLTGAIPVKQLGTHAAVARQILEAATQGCESDLMEGSLNAVRSASMDSVNKVIKNNLRPDQATLVIAGSGQSIKAVRQLAAEARDPD
jgi:zinc protease